MARITIVDIQHKSFKKKLQGYDPVDVDQYLDEIIETLEDEAHARAALEGEVADLKERISHFKAMEESLQSTLLLAQRTADEVKASAHKEADLIKQEARIAAEREIAVLGDRIDEARREAQRAGDTAEQVKQRAALAADVAPLPDRARPVRRLARRVRRTAAGRVRHAVGRRRAGRAARAAPAAGAQVRDGRGRRGFRSTAPPSAASSSSGAVR